MKIQVNHSLLSDSPMHEGNKELFSFADKNTGDLIEDISHGNPACYLISGYRGSGKTSFIKKIEAEVILSTGKTKREIVFVYSNFPTYENHTLILRKLIRGLHNSLKDRSSFKQAGDNLLLGELYDKTFFETSYQSQLSHKKEKVTVVNIDIIELIKFLVPLAVLVTMIKNFFRPFIGSTDIIKIGATVLSVFFVGTSFLKITKSLSKKRTEQHDYNRKSLYDNEIADYHFLNILEQLKEKYQVVFVLDEVDKLSDANVDDLMNGMKPYFISGSAGFIIVAGQSLFYKYSAARQLDDSLLSSLFSKFIHVPLASSIELKSLFNRIIIADPDLIEKQKEVLDFYCSYLIVESKKIPRKFISLIRQHLVWENEKAFLYIDESSSRLPLFSKVNEIIERVDSTEIVTQGLDEAVRDYCVMQLYLKTHTILHIKKNQFNFDEIRSAEEQKENMPSWTKAIQPLLDNFFKSVFLQLEEQGIIHRLSSEPNKENFYTLIKQEADPNSPVTSTEPAVTSNNIHPIFNLRNVVKAVYRNLDYPDSKTPHHLPLSKMLIKLQENAAFKVEWKNRSEIMDFIDKENLIGDTDIAADIDRKLEENNFNPAVIITQLLEYFGTEKVKQYFGNTHINPSSVNKTAPDFLVLKPSNNTSPIHFNFKFRKANPVPDKELLLEAIGQLNTELKPSFIVLIIFTWENSSLFDKFQFQFRQLMLNDFKESPGAYDKIKFIPVSLMTLEMLNEEFEKFKTTYIEDKLQFIFKNQIPPRGFTDRNDHFLERDIDFKKTGFKIILTPKTNFWRFGFRFIQQDIFPPLSQKRDANEDVADIHICVGEPEIKEGEYHWKAPEMLTITYYNAESLPLQTDFRGTNNYDRSPVALLVISTPDGSHVTFEVIVNNRSLGKAVFDLSTFKYCRMAAWADEIDFEIDADITMTHYHD